MSSSALSPKMSMASFRYIHCAFLALLVSVAPSGLSQGTNRNNERPTSCNQWDNVAVPPGDLPTMNERKLLASCNSEDLYFGFDHAPDPVKARKCAYLERQAGSNVQAGAFQGSALLTMIYANGKGADQNLDLSLKFSCESIGAPAESSDRFEHLLKIAKGCALEIPGRESRDRGSAGA